MSSTQTSTASVTITTTTAQSLSVTQMPTTTSYATFTQFTVSSAATFTGTPFPTVKPSNLTTTTSSTTKSASSSVSASQSATPQLSPSQVATPTATSTPSACPPIPVQTCPAPVSCYDSLVQSSVISIVLTFLAATALAYVIMRKHFISSCPYCSAFTLTITNHLEDCPKHNMHYDKRIVLKINEPSTTALDSPI